MRCVEMLKCSEECSKLSLLFLMLSIVFGCCDFRNEWFGWYRFVIKFVDDVYGVDVVF